MRWLMIVMATLMAAIGGVVCADTWAPPETRAFLSPDKRMRFTVVPRGIASPLTYFEDKAKGREPAGQAPAGEKRARGLLERRGPRGWTTVWTRPLVNDVAPVDAMVSDDGAHVVTFDNWHTLGLGRDVVVIYRTDGATVASLALSDIIPPDYLAALPRSISSIHWRRLDRTRIDGRTLHLAVVIPGGEEWLNPAHDTVAIAIDLETGAVAPPAGPAWDRALAAARKANAASAAHEAKRKAEFVAPLLAPAGRDEGAWHDYLGEAFLRLDPDWKRRYPSTTILRDPAARDYAASEAWVGEALRDLRREDAAMFAAPSAPERLVEIVRKTAPGLKPGSLATSRIYVAAPRPAAEAIRAALAPSGAQIVWLDATRPIPQRPERLRGETPDDVFAIP